MGNAYVEDLEEQFIIPPLTDMPTIDGRTAGSVTRHVTRKAVSPLDHGSIVEPFTRESLQPLDRTAGGEMAPTLGRLGWSEGIRPTRWAAPLHDGQAIVMPGVNVRQTGPIGQLNHDAKLQAGVRQMYTDYTPTDEQVAGLFTVQDHSLTRELLSE